ncbi:MAG TPA: class I adenylate-forming enzyme family protein, partial [Solirubrobacterales bacterium]|nr:class I adenylate-forming enzyme family protein [Solirubrobacterales bacterium]
IYALPRDGKALGTDDVLQSPIPLYTAASLMENIYSPVFSGCLLACEGRRFDAARSLQRIDELGSTIYNGAPPHFAMMCDLPDTSQPERLELMITGGSAFTRPLFEKIRRRWPQVAVANWFGLMESGSGQTLNWGEDMEREPDTLGRPVWPTEARVVDADLNDVEVGGEGELWLRAPGQIEGYFKNPEQTAKRLHEGWLRTGDRVVETEDGRFRGRGRGEDRINRGGFKFYPVEIETVLEAHPDVREAAAIGISHEVLGENVVAFVVHGDGGEVGEEELRTYCRQSLAPNKIPARIYFEESLPRNAYGKVVRKQLRELIEQREASAAEPG